MIPWNHVFFNDIWFISIMKSPAIPALIRCRRTGRAPLGGPAHAYAAPEPPASESEALMGSTSRGW